MPRNVVRYGARVRALVAALACMLALACGGRPGPPPNLVLITVCTLRADRLGSYGWPNASTPHFDALAAEGTRFSDVTTTIPRTTPSVATLFSGRYPHEHGLLEIGDPLPPDVPVLAEILRNAGYATAGISANGAASKLQRLDRGFEHFVDYYDLTRRHRIWMRTEQYSDPAFVGFAQAVTREVLTWLKRSEQRPYFLWLLYVDPHFPYSPPTPHNLVIDWKQFDFYEHFGTKVRGRPVAFFNLDGDSERALPDLSRLYDAEVRYLDGQVGVVLRALAELGDDANTVVAVTADHGESLGEHGMYYEHGDLVYQGDVRVPWIVHGPGVAPGKTIELPVSNVDVLPTLLGLLGVEPPPGFTPAGLDLSQLVNRSGEVPSETHRSRTLFAESGSALLPQNPRRLLGGTLRPREFKSGRQRQAPVSRFVRDGRWVGVERHGVEGLAVFDSETDPRLLVNLSETEPGIEAALERLLGDRSPGDARLRVLRSGPWKLIRSPGPREVGYELYDLERDPGESHDLYRLEPERAAELTERLDSWTRKVAEAVSPTAEPPSVEEEREIEERLRSLGYLE